jgi:hypothetical protein
VTFKYFNVKNGLTTGNIALHSSNGNVVANTFVGNLNVTGTANLGNVSNLVITGGTANYVLTTDGAGNLSWAAPGASGGITSISDNFTGNGVQNTFTLSTAPANENLTFVNYNGALLLRDDYTISGNTITFSTPPGNGYYIEVTTLSGNGGSGVGASAPAGSNTQLQFNDAGNLSGNAGLTFDKTTTTLSANNLAVPGRVTSSLIPNANITYDLGTSNLRWRDLWLSGNTIHLGETQITSANNIVVLPEGTKLGNVPLPVELSSMNDVDSNISPEVFTINVDFPNAGHGDDWFWTWDAGTVAYSRSKVTNAVQATVPIYESGTYVVNNFAAHDLHGNMTQTHKIYLKWINGAGLDNLVSWAPSTLNVANVSHPDINGGANTTVQRLNINVPADVTVPQLTPPNVSYNVTVANMQWSFSGTTSGNNPTIGPVYRGGTYTFNLSNTAGHPFYLTTDNGGNFAGGQYVGEYTNGVTGSRNTSGNLTITIPNNAPNTLYYQCGNHGSMRGQINVRNLAVETNASGNLILYFQHTQEGHFTPCEIRPKPNLQTISSACLVYNGATGKFEIKDMGQYLDETAQFQNRIENIVATETADKPTIAEVTQKIKEETVFTTTMYQRGNLELTTGTMRWFAPYNLQITNITPRLGTASGSNVAVMVKKNGANAQGFTFAPSATVANVANGNISMTTGDFLTVDITNVGVTNPGQDLYVQFTYKKV